MRGPKPIEILLNPHIKQLLEKIARCYTNEYRLVLRAKIILYASAGESNSAIARRLDTQEDTVRKWRRRWLAAQLRLETAVQDAGNPKELTALIEQVLADAPRPGTPVTFAPEQLACIVALACEAPPDSDREISHWTPRELADESVQREIVETISPRHVGRLLNEANIKPHLSRYWLTNQRAADPAAFDATVKQVCDTYLAAPELHTQGIHVICTDEKTGIQALERTHPTRPVRAGQVELREFEYIRHGTLCLIPNFEVATGQIIAASLGPTRTEEDFVAHISQVIATDPDAEWVFVTDQLNTHKSAGLVNLVAQKCHIEEDLGCKGKLGILKSMKTRQVFLEDSEHRIRFLFTPVHTSWLNQAELWFSILVRKLLKRASFNSLEDLQHRILKFIDYFNATMAKPFKWTYTGRPLAA